MEFYVIYKLMKFYAKKKKDFWKKISCFSLFAYLNSKHILTSSFWLSFAETMFWAEMKIPLCCFILTLVIKYGRLESILSTAYI